jgi:hypothetical protein
MTSSARRTIPFVDLGAMTREVAPTLDARFAPLRDDDREVDPSP